MKVYFNLIKGFYFINIILPVTTGFLNILLKLEVYLKCKFNTTALSALKGPYRNALKAIQNTSNRLAAIHILLQANKAHTLFSSYLFMILKNWSAS